MSQHVTGYSTQIEKDPITNWKIIHLNYHDKDPNQNLSAGILPQAGSNLFSLKLGEEELLLQSPIIQKLTASYYGIPVLYPTPNRVRNSQFTFAEQTYRFMPNWKEHFLHGLVHSAPWEFNNPVSNDREARLQTFINFKPRHSLFSLWPFKHRISLDFILDHKSIKIIFSIQNHDKKSIPFGFALHPFFRYIGKKKRTYLVCPAKYHMINGEDLLPTGKIEFTDGTDFDIHKPVRLEGLDLDDVFWGMEPDQPAWFDVRDKKIKVDLQASEEFTHMVIYTGNPEAFCMENQTCSTDAHNLHAKGFDSEAHLLIVEPGKTMSMWIKYSINRYQIRRKPFG